MPDYLKLKHAPTSPPPGSIIVPCKDIKAGDQIWGCRYIGASEWTWWTGSIIKAEPRDITVLDESARIFKLEAPDGRTLDYEYYSDLEFLVIRLYDAAVSPLDDRYPHQCPKCDGAAYINFFNHVDCKAGCS